jgi:probable addiction module antidote protein
MTTKLIDPNLLPIFDPADVLDNDESRALYIEEALATNDPAFIARCLGDVARSAGMSKVASDAGLTRASLYKTLSSDGNPEFGTILRVMQALGLRLSVSTVVAESTT